MGKGRSRRALSPAELAERYCRSVAEGRSAVRWDRDPAAQAESYRLAEAACRERMAAVRALLNQRGVPLCLRLPLTNFARHCEKVCRNYTRRTRAVLLRMAVDRWVRYGLARELLVTVCRDCFDSVPLGESSSSQHSSKDLGPQA
jgi:hypothetical protein